MVTLLCASRVRLRYYKLALTCCHKIVILKLTKVTFLRKGGALEKTTHVRVVVDVVVDGVDVSLSLLQLFASIADYLISPSVPDKK